MKRVSFENY